MISSTPPMRAKVIRRPSLWGLPAAASVLAVLVASAAGAARLPDTSRMNLLFIIIVWMPSSQWFKRFPGMTAYGAGELIS